MFTYFYIPPLITSCITPPALPRIAPCHSPHWLYLYSTSHNVPHSMPHPTLYLIPHHTTFHIAWHSPHSTSFHITQRSTFPPTSHTLPHSTSHNVPHSIPQPTLRHSTSHNVPHSIPQSPLYLVAHRTTFHIPCHSTHTSPYYTTTFHNSVPFERLGTIIISVIRFMLGILSFFHGALRRHSFTYNLLYHISNPTQKWWWKSATLFIKCQNK